jgi:hypothetical protein
MKQRNPSLVASSEYTPEQYLEDYYPRVERICWHVGRNRIIWSFLRRVPPRRALDAGCGRGILLDYLAGAAVDRYGLELGNPPVNQHLRQRLLCGKASGILPAEFGSSAPVIVLGDVIELVPGPSPVADFPAAQSFVAAVPARSELSSDHSRHFWLCDERSLEAALITGSIETFESSRMFRLFYPATGLMPERGDRSWKSSGEMRAVQFPGGRGVN